MRPSSLGMSDSVRLSFSLSRAQLALNPPERIGAVFVAACLATAPLLVLLKIVVHPLSLDRWLLLGIATAMSCLAFRLVVYRPTLLFLMNVFRKRYINAVVIEGDWVGIGIGEPEVWLHRKSLLVGRGLLGTSIVRDIGRGLSIVVPPEAIRFTELKALIRSE